MRIEVMSSKGDELLAEWDARSSPAELNDIAQDFGLLRAKGYRAFGAVTGLRADHFNAEIDEDLIFIAPMVGG
jgi:hypothetical protein